MKNCKFCYSEIDKRARICPHCHRQLAMVGAFQSFLTTAFPILTALISLSFAFYEKYEKGLVQDSLVQTEHRLEATEIQHSVAEEAVTALSRMVPPPPAGIISNVDASSPQLTPEMELKTIETKIADLDFTKDVNKADLKKMYERRLDLKAGRNLFRK